MLLNKIIRWWQTPQLPEVHIWIPEDKRPKGLYQTIRIYFRKWIIHPIKRRIAKYYLILLKSFFGLKVIGITGSAGKTTTKEMLASILKQDGETVVSFANIDPVYNIPTTILKCKPSTKYLVLEMGIEYPNEMDFYLWLASVDIGIITNIFPTHTLFLKNEEGVFKEKSKLVKSMSKNGYAILNLENKFLKFLKNKIKAEIIWFGKNSKIYYKNYKLDSNLNSKFDLIIDNQIIHINFPILGEQFIQNALAAAAAANALNISTGKIKKGLENFSLQEHRMKVIKYKENTIIDDSYNNNPEAAQNALETLKLLSREKKIGIVFGDMLELGKEEKKYHLQIAKKILELEPDFVISVGALSKTIFNITSKTLGKNSIWFDKGQNKKIVSQLKKYIKSNYIVLIKGSRSIGLDGIISKL